MKKSMFLIVAMLFAGLLTLSSCNQGKKSAKEEGTKVPDQVMKAFQAKFPAAKEVEWGMESETEYEAGFMLDSTKMYANFDTAGNWKETEWQVDNQELPESIVSVLKNDYSGFNVEKAEISDTPEAGKVYELQLKNDSTSVEIVLDENGTNMNQGEKEEGKEVKGEQEENEEHGEKEEHEEKEKG